ncbi:hypothetical protein GGS20DRAFT_546883 [Poronia punctata]|nr:hypothetical protein GGS20DRAFT_546883 [Poronia punctata]
MADLKRAGQQPVDASSPSKKRQSGRNDNGPHISATLEPQMQPFSGPAELDSQKEELRQELLNRLSQLSTTVQRLRGKAARERVASEQQDVVAAISVLEAIDDTEWEFWLALTSKKSYGSLDRWIVNYGQTTREAIDLWMQKTTREELQDGEVRSATTKQWQKMVAIWYRGLCIVTRRNSVEACHILADSITRTEERIESFFKKLAVFWPIDRVEHLRSFVKQPENVPKNLMVLRSDVHQDWAKAKFAFRPRDHSSSRLVLEFVWLAPTTPRGGVSYSRDPEDTTDLIYQGPSTSTTDPTFHVLHSWDRIVLESNNPREAPLPSWELLQLQWDMQRISRASAAADVLASIFTRQEPPGEAGALAGEYNDEKEECSPCIGPCTPRFTTFLLDEAVDQGILASADRPEVERYFLPFTEENPLEEEADMEDAELVLAED